MKTNKIKTFKSHKTTIKTSIHTPANKSKFRAPLAEIQDTLNTLRATEIQDTLNTLRATRKYIIRSQSLINDDELLEVDSLRRLICMLHTKTAVARQAYGRLRPVYAKSP
ncbi:hypothetical protein ACN0IJ_19825, partial [Shewanella indica]|uniref:hypothetical protein n=1 Tax=Shewanella indica TaxID=768528 RepID=UPI003D36D76F